MLKTYKVPLCMGQGRPEELHFLTNEEIEEFNYIGYTGKRLDGIYTTQLEYLNSLGKGEFAITPIKANGAEFTESILISHYKS